MSRSGSSARVSTTSRDDTSSSTWRGCLWGVRRTRASRLLGEGDGALGRVINRMPRAGRSRTLSGTLDWNADYPRGRRERTKEARARARPDPDRVRRASPAPFRERPDRRVPASSCIPRCGARARGLLRAFRRRPEAHRVDPVRLGRDAASVRAVVRLGERARARRPFLERDAGIVDEVEQQSESNSVVARDTRLHADRAQALAVGLALVEQRRRTQR